MTIVLELAENMVREKFRNWVRCGSERGAHPSVCRDTALVRGVKTEVLESQEYCWRTKYLPAGYLS
jgi:hypothetical protein